ncbi:MAG: uracil-DNA glycosylase [Clostridia bacterium]|nr:uracil-DNA glycosylase [Clostridia bacterium]
MHDTLQELKKEIEDCRKCKLCTEKNNIVLGVGNENAEIMFIGEGLCRDENEVGNDKTWKLLNQAFLGIGMDIDSVYFANIVKCITSNNRTLENEEVTACMNYLRNQVLIIKPKIIVLLGNVALKNILGEEYGITSIRGKWIEKKGILYMPTFHPAALIKNENLKIDFWRDLKLVLDKKNNLN